MKKSTYAAMLAAALLVLLTVIFERASAEIYDVDSEVAYSDNGVPQSEFANQPAAANLISDDFNICQLDPARWQIVDPQAETEGESMVLLTGEAVALQVPGESAHDIGNSGILAPHILQAVENEDFALEVKISAAITESGKMHGILISQDAESFLRVNVEQVGASARLRAVLFAGGAALEPFAVDASLPSAAAPFYLRVERTGDSWQLLYSYDGFDWQGGSDLAFTHALAVASVGLFAGNFGDDAPAHTALFDYFFDADAPIAPEDNRILFVQDLALDANPDNVGAVLSEPVAPDPANPGCGIVQRLTATATVSGWTFSHWEINQSQETSNPLERSFFKGDQVSALFIVQKFALDVTTGGSGGGTVNRVPDLTSIDVGEIVTLTAIPETGAYFVNWEGDISGDDPVVTITMDSDKSVVANFSDQYDVEVDGATGGDSSVAPEQATYTFGQEVELTAIPDAGWRFVAWEGSVQSTQNPLTVTVDGDMRLAPTFEQIAFAVNVSIDGMGAVARSPEQPTFLLGESVQLTANAADRWRFEGWSGAIISDVNPIDVEVTGDLDISATFVQSHATLSVTVLGEGEVKIDPQKELYKIGDRIVLTADPTRDWAFCGWVDACGTRSDRKLTIRIEGDLVMIAAFFPDERPDDVHVHLPLMVANGAQ